MGELGEHPGPFAGRPLEVAGDRPELEQIRVSRRAPRGLGDGAPCRVRRLGQVALPQIDLREVTEGSTVGRPTRQELDVGARGLVEVVEQEGAARGHGEPLPLGEAARAREREIHVHASLDAPPRVPEHEAERLLGRGEARVEGDGPLHGGDADPELARVDGAATGGELVVGFEVVAHAGLAHRRRVAGLVAQGGAEGAGQTRQRG